MPALQLDHINIAATFETLEKCVEFYSRILNLAVGHRPPFRRRGFWLYAGDSPIIHLTEAESDAVPREAPLNHVAFTCTDLDAVRDALARIEVPFTEKRVPATSQVQLFAEDPAGVHIELNFTGL